MSKPLPRKVEGTDNIILRDDSIRIIQYPDGKKCYGAMNDSGIWNLTIMADKGDLPFPRYKVKTLVDGGVFLILEV